MAAKLAMMFTLGCVVTLVLILTSAPRPAVAGSLPVTIVEQESRWPAASIALASQRIPNLFISRSSSGNWIKTPEWLRQFASIFLFPAPINHLRIGIDCPDVVLDLLVPVNNAKNLPSPSEDLFLTHTFMDKRFELTIRIEW